ncbi:integral membrane protein [Secundilactobacillus odoratitofui DSM 19909 = JCM 15043]|uniref:Integral membrane protein n=1 Tax=Secundilactobacillus odoratitofui DSM 19909 = JCM 15043 TaxID=1423776 RepID=A0A0R1M0V7_9LACO|nr:YitT family protein [Secundilactobacillus odoratitofui]KRK98162.1 integral membrane protein [Secundilactobacillus odoratitofui DSM 19909 = JCM 15043]
MDDVQRLIKRHQSIGKISTAFIYGILVSIAMNFFWTPGHIYSSGITGLAQLVTTLSERHLPFVVSTALGLFLLNVPLFILAWRQISHNFTVYTVIAVFLASLMIKLLHPVHLTTDPIICALFGGAVNGFGTGLALKNGISTGGLDILGIVIRRKTGRSIGTINIAFNSLIIIAAGFLYGWPYAFYSAIGLVVNARVMDMTYTRQQLMQVMIITDRPKTVIDSIQNHIRRGITIVHDAEGAYHHDTKTILFTVISRYEMSDLEEAMDEADSHAFVSVSEIYKVLGHFYEPKL